MDDILRGSLPKLREKLLESLQAVLPIVAIVLVLCFSIAPVSPSILLCFLLGAAMIIVGIMFFTLGAEMSMSDTSMMKLSTATGYIYGFVQDVDSGMWQYIALDFNSGKTVLTVDVSSLYGYNNMAIGMYAGRDGNKLYCPHTASCTMSIPSFLSCLPSCLMSKQTIRLLISTLVWWLKMFKLPLT